MGLNEKHLICVLLFENNKPIMDGLIVLFVTIQTHHCAADFKAPPPPVSPPPMSDPPPTDPHPPSPLSVDRQWEETGSVFLHFLRSIPLLYVMIVTRQFKGGFCETYATLLFPREASLFARNDYKSIIYGIASF